MLSMAQVPYAMQYSYDMNGNVTGRVIYYMPIHPSGKR